jgi:CRP-like cAMP-binding protein
VRLFTQNVKVEALGRVPLFEGLSKKDLRDLARVTDDLAVPAGTVLCREGAPGREFFVIVDGTVEVTTGGKRLATRGAGEFLGEIALITTRRRTASVTAITPLRCFILTSGDFRRVLDENPKVERKVLQALAERLLSHTPDAALVEQR